MSKRQIARARVSALAALVLAALPLLVSSAAHALGPYSLVVSKSPDRATPVSLDGTTQSGVIYVFTSQSGTSDISKVEFWLDDPQMTGSPRKSEGTAPYDFAGGTVSVANPFDTKSISDGSHTITAKITHNNGTAAATVSATFTVQNSAPATPNLVFNPTSMSFTATEGDAASSQTAQLSTSNSSAAGFTITDDASWLTASPTSGTTPASLQISANPTGLTAGTYNGTVTATASGYTSAALSVTLKVNAPSTGGCAPISPLPCSNVLVTLPYKLDFSSNAGKLADKNAVGTGFTMVDPPTNGTGYIPGNLLVTTGSPGTLNVTTTNGLASTTSDSQDNALGVGVKPGKVVLLKTTVVNPPVGTGKYEQAGLWWGNNEDNYVKLVVRSKTTTSGVVTQIELSDEQNGTQGVNSKISGAVNVSSAKVELALKADPGTDTVTGSYSVNGGAPVTLATFTEPAAFFTHDAAGVDPTIGTNTFGGIFASHRNATSALTYTFDNFSLEDVTPAPPPPSGNIIFNKFSIGATVAFPTAMAFGPDGRLYVTEMMGKIHALTLNSAHQVTADQVITAIGDGSTKQRLTLGITVDPASTPTNVILWVAHSDPDLAGPSSVDGSGGAAADSGIVSKLSGTNFATRTDVITGIPRSQANHSTNNIEFGPDGKLYIAQAGNTGAGAPNTSSESLGEFGTREEQPLSAAILVADVKATGFDGSCHNTTSIYGAPPCSVTTYATGLRNPYDLAWHSNGTLYAPDNGASVGPTYPNSPTPPCTGNAPWPANDPGDQNDFLYRVIPGKYYGHPNPRRLPTAECVFKDGSLQGVAPLANYEKPIADLGKSKSADGIIEYRGNAFGGALNGNLLVTNWSVGDDITRVILSADGKSVAKMEVLVGGFNNPLPIVEGPDGTIYVGEHGADVITALVPAAAIGTWTTKASIPVAILDAGGTALNGKLYFIAGKTSAGPRRTMYIYNPTSDSWTTGPDLPSTYPAVENPAVTVYNGKLYVFGGSTSAFSGSVKNAAVYDPATNSWSMLASMPVARGGARAEAIGTKIYVVGGMDAGASLASMSVYDPSTNAWSSGPSMATRRDNPGSAALGGVLYVFGGRTRNADGTAPAPTLNTVEAYNPATNTWSAKASMPTGRRTMAVGLLNGRAQLMGGEKSTTTTGTFSQNEEYDPVTNTWRSLAPMPTPRHGTVAGTINSVVYVAGGGKNTGSSYTATHEAFSY